MNQLVPGSCEGEVVDLALGRDDDVIGGLTASALAVQRGALAPRLSHPALDAVPEDGLAHLARNGNPDPARVAASHQEVEDETTPVDPLAAALEPQELPALAQAEFRREALIVSAFFTHRAFRRHDQPFRQTFRHVRACSPLTTSSESTPRGACAPCGGEP